jgi:hypothetical protein
MGANLVENCSNECIDFLRLKMASSKLSIMGFNFSILAFSGLDISEDLITKL